jgi:hypothetical protein
MRLVKKFKVFLLLAVVVAVLLLGANLALLLVIRDEVPRDVDVIFSFGGERVRQTYSEELRRANPNAWWIVSGYDKAGFYRRALNHGVDTTKLVFVDTCSSTWSEVRFLYDWLNRPTPPSRGESDSSATHTMPAFSRSKNVQVALVSGPYHMRRINLLVNWAFGSGRRSVLYSNHQQPQTDTTQSTIVALAVSAPPQGDTPWTNASITDTILHTFLYAPVPLERYGLSSASYRQWWKKASIRRLVFSEYKKIAGTLIGINAEESEILR